MKKYFLQTIVAALFLGGISFFQACGDSEDVNGKVDMESMDPAEREKNEKAEKVRKILYSIPSPVETAHVVKLSGVDFDKNSMNDANNVGDYSTTKRQAVNLGVYGADLAYSSIFEQSREALRYFSAVKLLSDELGVSSIINDENISRFERNIENRDSLVVFINEIFWAIDATLSEDDRGYVSAIVMTGGWVEALYILMYNGRDVQDAEDRKRIKQLIADQQYSLNNIIKLLDVYREEADLSGIVADMESINQLLEQVTRQRQETTISKEDGKVVLGGQDQVAISDDLYEEIYAVVRNVRDKYVN